MTDIVKRLSVPHEWGYRDPIEGMFFSDNTPFEAADEIDRLREALREIVTCETQYANSTVRRMTGIARAALEGRTDG